MEENSGVTSLPWILGTVQDFMQVRDTKRTDDVHTPPELPNGTEVSLSFWRSSKEATGPRVLLC